MMKFTMVHSYCTYEFVYVSLDKNCGKRVRAYMDLVKEFLVEK